MIEFQEAKRIAGMLAAVGEPTRMMILHCLAEGPAHVGDLAERVGVPMVNMSHHLGVMRQAGLLDDTKSGRRVVYAIRDEVFRPGGDGTLGTFQFGVLKLTLNRIGPAANGAKKPAAEKPAKPSKPAAKAEPAKPAKPAKKKPGGSA